LLPDQLAILDPASVGGDVYPINTKKVDDENV
jgi:hypothetical protein